jgi:phage FluMu protein Com
MENQNGEYATGSDRENNVTARTSEFHAVFVDFLCPRIKLLQEFYVRTREAMRENKGGKPRQTNRSTIKK